jgi:hypothetical protein
MENDAIVSTGIYYYRNKNITESQLHFKTLANENDLGYIECTEGKCVTFPNIYLHWVSPFELIDKTLPGVRKILVFFLVDPTKTVLSSRTIAPQSSNKSWDISFLKKNTNMFDNFVLDDEFYKKGRCNDEVAFSIREELMEERRDFKFVEMKYKKDSDENDSDEDSNEDSDDTDDDIDDDSDDDFNFKFKKNTVYNSDGDSFYSDDYPYQDKKGNYYSIDGEKACKRCFYAVDLCEH